MEAKPAQLEKEGKATTQQAGMAGGLANTLDKGLSFDEVPAMGDFAVWNNRDKQLHVFYRGIGFQLMVDAYADGPPTRKNLLRPQKPLFTNSSIK